MIAARRSGMANIAVPCLSVHGAKIPAIGFGTSGMGNNCGGAVAKALELGYRHLDTAWKYGSERAVGEGMRASGVPRDEIFLTTKVSHEYLRAADFARSVDESLNNLGVDRVDLLLVHWPNSKIPLAETMGALAKAKRDGLARHVGVANFNIALLDQAIALCPEPLVALEAEYHPYLDQSKLLRACGERGMIYIAYCPLARGRIFNDAVLGHIARAKRKTIAQVALRWLLQKNGVAAIPRSSNAERIAQNLDLFDFTLSDQEVARIDGLKRRDGRIANPAGRAPQWDD
jgi:diketogulonate reductase-like aldo/keto reductase